MDNGEISLPGRRPATPPTGALDIAGAPDYPSHRGPDPFAQQRQGRVARARSRVGSAFAALAALVAKFFAAIKAGLLLLPKAKLLTTSATALVSIAAYSLFFGWWFAVGLVILLFVHEMGHVIQLRREGIKASPPMFIPFLGAVITARSLGDDAAAEARVGLAGPVLGTVGAIACWGIAEATNSNLLRALAYFGFFLNLFNLLPVVPLDGGRAMAAMSPWMWFVGFGCIVFLAVEFPNPILFIILFFSALELWRRWNLRNTRTPAQVAYYRVAPRHRLLVGAVYVGLIVVLAFGMHETHILSASGHSFSSIHL